MRARRGHRSPFRSGRPPIRRRATRYDADRRGVALTPPPARLYVTNQNGTTIVFRPNPEKFELLAENNLNEHCNSTIAVSDGQIFLRTFQHLYCIGE
ncbi:MAG: hypothetical protein EXS05_22000 [Planctomycetaceae bacterium]|nr:hypothetical protein [Planctomycetaceae bacterium]